MEKNEHKNGFKSPENYFEDFEDRLFNKLSEEGKTIIMVTHDTDIAKHAYKIYKLKDGRIVNK